MQGKCAGDCPRLVRRWQIYSSFHYRTLDSAPGHERQSVAGPLKVRYGIRSRLSVNEYMGQYGHIHEIVGTAMTTMRISSGRPMRQ